MSVGDLCFLPLKHWKRDCGIVKVIKKAFVDKTDKKKRFLAVQVRFVEQFNLTVSLEKIKKPRQFPIYLLLNKVDYQLCL